MVMSNDKMELTILTTGGSLANLVLTDDPEKLSPFWNPVRMARAMRLAVEAGREAFLAGRMPRKYYEASPSSPTSGLIARS